MVINSVTTVGNWGRLDPEGAGRSWGKDASCSTLWPIDTVPTTIYMSSIYPLDEMGKKLLTVAGSEIADMCRETQRLQASRFYREQRSCAGARPQSKEESGCTWEMESCRRQESNKALGCNLNSDTAQTYA